jgi:hypothetical protein
MFSKLQPQELHTYISDIDRYFDTTSTSRPQISAKEKDTWLLSWSFNDNLVAGDFKRGKEGEKEKEKKIIGDRWESR